MLAGRLDFRLADWLADDAGEFGSSKKKLRRRRRREKILLLLPSSSLDTIWKKTGRTFWWEKERQLTRLTFASKTGIATASSSFRSLSVSLSLMRIKNAPISDVLLFWGKRENYNNNFSQIIAHSVRQQKKKRLTIVVIIIILARCVPSAKKKIPFRFYFHVANSRQSRSSTTCLSSFFNWEVKLANAARYLPGSMRTCTYTHSD